MNEKGQLQKTKSLPVIDEEQPFVYKDTNSSYFSNVIAESGSSYGGGAFDLSDRFVGSFLYIDKLGVSARDGADVVARHSMYKNRYALLDPDYNPNPVSSFGNAYNRVANFIPFDFKEKSMKLELQFYSSIVILSDYRRQ